MAPTARADGEPLAWVGLGLEPVDNDAVRMMWERVVITLSPVEAKVGVDFIFRNEGAAAEVTMGFPTVGFRQSPIQDLEAWVDGRKVEVSRQQDAALEDLYHWKVSFPKGGERRVRVRYRAVRYPGTAGTLAEAYFVYVLHSGARWKGPIGHAEIEINLVDIAPEQIIALQPDGFQQTAAGWRLLLDNFEPAGDVVIRFRPTALTVRYGKWGGGKWYGRYFGYPPVARGKTVLVSSRLFYFGADYKPEWDANSGTFIVRRGPLLVRCQAHSRAAFLGPREVLLSVAPEMRSGELLIPIELAEPLGVTAEYKPATKELVLLRNDMNQDLFSSHYPPAYEAFHLAGRRHLAAEYRADLKRLKEAALYASSAPARYEALFKEADVYWYLGNPDLKQAREAYAAAHTYKLQNDIPGPDWARWWQAQAILREGRRPVAEAFDIFCSLAITGCREEVVDYDDLVTLAAIEAAACLEGYRARSWQPGPAEYARALLAARLAEGYAASPFTTQLRVAFIGLLVHEGQHQEARAVAARLFETGDKTDAAFLETVKPLRKYTRFNEAGESLGYLFVEELAGTPPEEEILHAFADNLAARDKAEAIKYYTRLVERFPKRPHTPHNLRNIAQLTRELHGEEAYKKELWRLIREYPEDAEVCSSYYYKYATEEQLLWMAANLPRPYYEIFLRLADTYYLRGDYAAAADLLRAADRPGDLRDPSTVRVLLMQGLCSLHLGDQESATRFFAYLAGGLSDKSQDEILSAGPESVAAYIARAETYRGHRERTPERDILHQGLAKHPDSARLYQALGRSFLYEIEWGVEDPQARREIYRQAAAAFERAVTLAPDNHEFRLDLSKACAALGGLEGDAARKLDCYTRAIEHWKITAGLHPEDKLYKYAAVPDYLDPAVAYWQKAQSAR